MNPYDMIDCPYCHLFECQVQLDGLMKKHIQETHRFEVEN